MITPKVVANLSPITPKAFANLSRVTLKAFANLSPGFESSRTLGVKQEYFQP